MTEDVNDDDRRDDLDLDDPDSLPWLETADDYDEDIGPSAGKVLALVVGGLLLIGAVVGGIYLFQQQQRGGERGNGELIAAQEGDYKVRPDDPEGKSFEGEGDAAFAASEGKDPDSVANASAASKPATKPSSKTTSGATSAAKTGADAKGGALVQLGAYSSDAKAGQGWSDLTGRYDYLGEYSRRVTTATVDGRTVYRLSAVAKDSGAAEVLCAKLKSSGASCLVVR